MRGGRWGGAGGGALCFADGRSVEGNTLAVAWGACCFSLGGSPPPPAQSSDLLVLACPPFQGLGSCCSLCLQSSFLKMATWFISSPSSSVCSDITFSGSLAAAFKTVPRHPRHPWNFSCPPCFLRPYASHPLACLRLRLVCSPPGPVGGNVSSVLHSCGQQGLRNMAG